MTIAIMSQKFNSVSVPMFAETIIMFRLFTFYVNVDVSSRNVNS